jgi:hypothetical protein
MPHEFLFWIVVCLILNSCRILLILVEFILNSDICRERENHLKPLNCFGPISLCQPNSPLFLFLIARLPWIIFFSLLMPTPTYYRLTHWPTLSAQLSVPRYNIAYTGPCHTTAIHHRWNTKSATRKTWTLIVLVVCTMSHPPPWPINCNITPHDSHPKSTVSRALKGTVTIALLVLPRSRCQGTLLVAARGCFQVRACYMFIGDVSNDQQT